MAGQGSLHGITALLAIQTAARQRKMPASFSLLIKQMTKRTFQQCETRMLRALAVPCVTCLFPGHKSLWLVASPTLGCQSWEGSKALPSISLPGSIIPHLTAEHSKPPQVKKAVLPAGSPLHLAPQDGRGTGFLPLKSITEMFQTEVLPVMLIRTTWEAGNGPEPAKSCHPPAAELCGLCLSWPLDQNGQMRNQEEFCLFAGALQTIRVALSSA